MQSSNIFGPAFSWAVVVAGFCAGFTGLFFLQSALRRRGFSESVVSLTLLGIFGGTNLFHYTTVSMGMSHVYSFCLFSMVVWLLPKVYEKPGWANSMLLGLLTGWIVLIRPTNAALLFFIFLYDVYSRKDLWGRVRFLCSKIPYLIAAMMAGIVIVLPQLYYWHEMTRHWFIFSYRSDEGFVFWNHPKIADVFFNPQNGLFIYSPLILLAFTGIPLTWETRRFHHPAILFTLLPATYAFASWWCWWFGGAFGHRSFIEFYALLAFPLAGMLEKILNTRHKALKMAGISLVLCLIFYSVKMSFLYTHLPGAWDGPEWNWKTAKLIAVWRHLW